MKALLSVILMAAFCISITAQKVDKKEINKKLKELKGDVKEIVIKMDGKDVTFEGKDAEYLLKKIKETNKEKKIKVYMTDDESCDTEFIDLSDMDCSSHKLNGDSLSFKFNFDADCDPGTCIQKRVEIKMDGDEKIITETTTKDGKDEVKTYKGKEADEFLKSIEKENGCKTMKKIIIKTDKDED